MFIATASALDCGQKLPVPALVVSLRLFGIVHGYAWHASFLKDVLKGKIEGSRPRGRQRRRWIDDITEWTGKDIHQCTVEAQDSAKWKSVSSQPLEQGRHRE
ncbi:UDP-glucuronosyltransferase 2A1-like [Elysia marginata]|uniref:UDP-glucuronosyltransferase 2A1-like n=1 Tax=Elysia marginata TaxID=1093978 RepID=A0AAV4H1Q4_9GAST|nr:UDP-glucuronosyltransferase 2A1-like [Elysia marginata]